MWFHLCKQALLGVTEQKGQAPAGTLSPRTHWWQFPYTAYIQP